jgi:hypothetical protein
LTQGVYRFDPTLLDEIWATPVVGDIPCQVLHFLPEWCVYVETPGKTCLSKPMHGFFAHLEYDIEEKTEELRLFLDLETGLEAIPLHLGSWSLAESITRMIDYSRALASSKGVPLPPPNKTEIDAAQQELEPLVSLLLYLCSEASEVGSDDHRPSIPRPVKTKQGPRLFPPDKPTTWDVGLRLGPALRRARREAQAEPGPCDQRSGPRPHIRRAHWHGFWSGPRDAPEARKFTLRWLPPIPVNLSQVDELPAIVRPVD